MMLNKAFKCLIFDWDGTLMDSSARIVACLQAAALEMNLPALSVEKLSHIIGLSLDGAVAYLYPDISEEKKQQYGRAYKEQYLYKNTDPSPLFDGVEEMLSNWQKEGYLLTIATGKSRKGLQRHLEEYQLEPYFIVTKTADETASKPDPQMLKEIVLELDINVSEAVMIGDTTHDINMAKAINMPSIALAQGAHPRETIETSQPDVLLDSIQALPKWLASQA